MSVETVRATLRRLREERMLGRSLVVNWHSGEPLVLPAAFYEERFAAFLDLEETEIFHTMQTNGTILSEEHCNLIKRHDVSLGVSIDGPAFIHDLHRPRRNGSATHRTVMKNVQRLHGHSIPFKVIAVLSDTSLRHPDEMYDFFHDLGCEAVGFNFEEPGGENLTTSMALDGFGLLVHQFLDRFWSRLKSGGDKFRVREFDEYRNRISQPALRQNCQTEPFLNLSVGWNGDWSTFCPELLDENSELYGDFRFGNVLRDTFDDGLKTDKFSRVATDVVAGVAACRTSCGYFEVCYGGNPSNKIAENGTFNSTQTLACTHRTMSFADFVMEKLERERYPAGTSEHGHLTMAENVHA